LTVCCEAAAPGASRQGLELAEIVRQYAGEVPHLSVEARRVLEDIARCRTAALGGHVHKCDQCDHRENSYNSCRNRHCPKCGSLAQVRWLEARQADLLPVPYFHVVFTVPDVLHPLFRASPAVSYNLLFAAVAETLKEVALNPAHLGARVGLTAVLHTWTQKLLFHPHLHCLVPGGGLSADGTRWVPCKPGFFLPVRVLSVVFRGKLLDKLERAIDRGELTVATDEDPRLSLEEAARKKWVVYSKAPFAGPEQVLWYLGRYTHRIALSNDRLLSLDGRVVRFRWRDRADGGKVKVLTLDAVAFLQRFLLHLLPKGFMRIRHYGFLANALRQKSVARCRELLAGDDDDDARGQPAVEHETWQELLLRLTGVDVTRCPKCGAGHLRATERIPEAPDRWVVPGRAGEP